MTDLFKLILGILASRFKARATLEAENLVLRQQVNVLRRRTPKRPHLNNTDRFLFVWLYRWFPSVLEVVAIVRPETIIRWHRAGFRTYWRWRSRNRVGRPKVSAELRTLIGEMSRARRVFMVSCSNSASRSPSRRSLGTCAATRGHRLRAGGRFSAITPTASRRSTSLSCRRSPSKFCIVLSLCATDDDFGCRLALRQTQPRRGSRARSPRRSRGTTRRDISFGIETPRMVPSFCSGSVQWTFGTIRSHPDRPGKMLTLSDSSARSAANVSTTRSCLA